MPVSCCAPPPPQLERGVGSHIPSLSAELRRSPPATPGMRCAFVTSHRAHCSSESRPGSPRVATGDTAMRRAGCPWTSHVDEAHAAFRRHPQRSCRTDTGNEATTSIKHPWIRRRLRQIQSRPHMAQLALLRRLGPIGHQRCGCSNKFEPMQSLQRGQILGKAHGVDQFMSVAQVQQTGSSPPAQHPVARCSNQGVLYAGRPRPLGVRSAHDSHPVGMLGARQLVDLGSRPTLLNQLAHRTDGILDRSHLRHQGALSRD